MEFDDVVRARRSVRGFIPDQPVPRATLLEALELARWAPSNCNVQPWRVFIASGERCQRLRRRLVEAANQGRIKPRAGVDKFEGHYRDLQVACAVELYSKTGVKREDKVGRHRSMLRNYEFFDAPHQAVICMEQSFGKAVALDVGIYLQTLMLALTARGVASCAQGSMRHCADLLREELGIPENLEVLCGLSFGYEDPSAPANQTRQARDPLQATATLLEA